ncbi:hypothetical protein RRG08_026089 [Elysia crispata]|uniref:Uncharacterized protein n=1 Tax=Elysia crispata TaxID=231223 RepID=A0AAE1D3A2_9GAST|nr:hypothetical protein RRG08_026089 [Elysia crispata]
MPFPLERDHVDCFDWAIIANTVRGASGEVLEGPRGHCVDECRHGRPMDTNRGRLRSRLSLSRGFIWSRWNPRTFIDLSALLLCQQAWTFVHTKRARKGETCFMSPNQLVRVKGRYRGILKLLVGQNQNGKNKVFLNLSLLSLMTVTRAVMAVHSSTPGYSSTLDPKDHRLSSKHVHRCVTSSPSQG